MRSRIFLKLLLTLLVTLAVIMLLMLVVVNSSFQRGFVSYLQQDEINRVTKVADLLAEQYIQQGSWDFMRGNFDSWERALESSGIAVPPQRFVRPPPQHHERPPPQQGERPPPPHRRPPPPAPHRAPEFSAPDHAVPPADGVPLGIRITLFDAERQPVLGPGNQQPERYWIAIKTEGVTSGWLGFLPVSIVTDQLAQRFMEQQKNSFTLVALVVLLLSVLVAAMLARFFLQPIHRVVQGAKQLASGDYETRVPVKGQDELAELAFNFNQMAEALQRNEQLRQRWVADISHELRTPIAIISGEVEALLDGLREPTQMRLASLYSEIGSLGKLVEDLHQLSLSDQYAMELSCHPVDVYALIQAQVLIFQPRAEARQLSLVLASEWSPHFKVMGDENRLAQLVSNLLENSTRYTDAGGEICIELTTVDHYCVLHVLDSSPGVPESALPKLFDRLYRVDKSRSRLMGGSGLGLSICKNITEAQGGYMKAKNRPEGGLKISVYLPRLPLRDARNPGSPSQ
ncbi:MAG: ATP-binding protein [Pontibacterium sp.]